MDRVPENARDVEEFILSEVLRGIDLDPQESLSLLSYMRDRHEHLFGPFTTYFVLGSYERPFKFRLEIAVTELNSRLRAYAYILAPQPDPELPEGLPPLKVKFYLHAIYADWIALVLEHNTGGAVAEFGRADRPFLFDRTYVFPRGYDAHHDDAVESRADVHAHAIELAYKAEGRDALRNELGALAEQAATSGLSVTIDELTAHLEEDLGGRLLPSYSSVVTDGIDHYERVGRCLPWTTEHELRNSINELP